MSIIFGLLAASLQIAGYLLYIRDCILRDVRPNAASWLMFAYGTSLVAVLTWVNTPSWPLIALPIACAIMSIAIAAMSFRKGTSEPITRFETIVFSTDVWLTIGFISLYFGIGAAASMPAGFLIIADVTAITSFVPIIASTYRSPYREEPWPWLIWAIAYACMFAASVGAALKSPVVLLYPSLCLALCLIVAALAVRRSLFGRETFGPDKSIYIGRSKVAGLGIFAGRSFKAGERLWQLTGSAHFSSASDADPYFLGVAPGIWIEPDDPIKRLNHSCAPNVCLDGEHYLVALKPIKRRAEIFLDYSTTEADPAWAMECNCGTPRCRKHLRAIQISFAHSRFPPAASPIMQQIWRNWRGGNEDEPAFPQLFDEDVRIEAHVGVPAVPAR